MKNENKQPVKEKLTHTEAVDKWLSMPVGSVMTFGIDIPSPESKEVETIEYNIIHQLAKEYATERNIPITGAFYEAFIGGYRAKTNPNDVYTRAHMIEFGEKVKVEAIVCKVNIVPIGKICLENLLNK